MQASHDLEQQSICLTMCAMSVYVKGMQIWNFLCDDIKLVNTVAAFKRKCKNLLFKKCILYMSRCLLMLYFVYDFVTRIKINMCQGSIDKKLLTSNLSLSNIVYCRIVAKCACLYCIYCC